MKPRQEVLVICVPVEVDPIVGLYMRSGCLDIPPSTDPAVKAEQGRVAALTSAAQMQSLPDLSSGSLGLARQQPAEAVTRMQEPIQILFNDSGQYFVNFSLDQSR